MHNRLFQIFNMKIKEKIEFINSIKIDERVAYWEELGTMSIEYLHTNKRDENLILEIINCLNGIRSSRFMESNVEVKILDVLLVLARTLKEQKQMLINILTDVIYYSNYYPERYNKVALDEELKELIQNNLNN